MIPTWITLISYLSITLGVICAAYIRWDVAKHPQAMQIMNWVWPLCALFGHLLVLFIYLRYGRVSAHSHSQHHGHSQTPFIVQVIKGAFHCGSGCTLGDIIAETLAYLAPSVAVLFGWHWLFKDKIFAVWGLDFILALSIGIVFQYLAIKPMSNMSRPRALIQAFKADFLSLIAWQVGMYGFMAFAHFYLFAQKLHTQLIINSASFWWMMQIAMVCGLITAFPVNYLLIRRGVKEAM
ncbi:protein of unknown function [Vibrio xiamenensis]|uniref:DUF4396 domain-containing protein n=1 Tax=Vibrio xiamenensis TaxID=861298 RepID=A0A1G8BV75_9VIBR|nr:DUF4396 domain-containing protein [Vibrio xiamenensis]SDH37044.1 protein of unknown function [Vibrio xiamenensis]